MSAMLQKLKARFDAVVVKMNDLNTACEGADGEVRDFSPEEEAAYVKLEAEMKSIETSIKREQDLDARKAASETAVRAAADPRAKDVTGTLAKLAPAQVAVRPSKDLNPFQKIAMACHCISKSQSLMKNGVMKSPWSFMEDVGYGDIGKDFQDATERALNTGVSASGGVMMPQNLSAEFIPFIYPDSAVIGADPVDIDLSSGSVRITGGDQSASASYRAEGADIVTSEATFKDMNMIAKNLAAMTTVSRELLERSPFSIEAIVAGDLKMSFLRVMDAALLRGTGSATEPTGLLNQIPAGQKIASAGDVDPSIIVIEAELTRVLTLVVVTNIPLIRLRWIMAPRTALYLEAKRDTTGIAKAFPTMSLKGGTLKGIPVFCSTQVPTNLTVTTNASEIYLIDFGNVYFGDTKSMELALSQEASFMQSGVLVSAFSRNLLAIRLIGAHDIALRQPKASAMLTGVKWGA